VGVDKGDGVAAAASVVPSRGPGPPDLGRGRIGRFISGAGGLKLAGS
jgi:hypothetical protein